jgi:hypothetical protein
MAAVYLIAVHNATDPEQLQQYLDEVFAIGGLEVLALDSAATTIEGDSRSRASLFASRAGRPPSPSTTRRSTKRSCRCDLMPPPTTGSAWSTRWNPAEH